MATLIEVHWADAFSTGEKRMARKLFRGKDLALVRKGLTLFDQIAARDARVAASTSPSRVNRTPIIPADEGALIDAHNRLLARLNALTLLETP